MRFSPYFLYFLKGGHRLEFLASSPLDNYYYIRFLEKSIPFSKFFLRIFFRRYSSKFYFFEKIALRRYFSTEALFFSTESNEIFIPTCFPRVIDSKIFQEKINLDSLKNFHSFLLSLLYLHITIFNWICQVEFIKNFILDEVRLNFFLKKAVDFSTAFLFT